MAFPGVPSNPLGSIGSALGVGGSNTPSVNQTTLPWNAKTSLVNSNFFDSIKIDGKRWNEIFPYRLMVIDTSTNSIVGGPSGAAISVAGGTSGTALVSFQALTSQWVLNLPITPQQLSITDNYSINTSATLLGVLEEHSGLRFKTIQASGTFGVWPFRSDLDNTVGKPTSTGLLGQIAGSLFANTISSATNVLAQVNKTISTFATGYPFSAPKTPQPGASGAGALTSTGYYQALQVQQFLEQYAEAKKNPANQYWRLVFDIPKQNQSLIVTPNQFNWIQSANKPTEFLFNLQFKAWRRINLQEKVTANVPNSQALTPGILQTILAGLSQARSTISAALSLVGAVTSDLEAPLNVLAQTVLFLKGLSGVAVAVVDLPNNVIKAYSSPLQTALGTSLAGSITSNSSSTTVANQINSIQASSQAVEGLSPTSVAGGQLGIPAATAAANNPINAIVANPAANYDLLNQVPVTSLTLTNAQQLQLNQLIAQAATTTVAQLKSYQQTILSLALGISNNYGTGNAFYNTVYSLPPPNLGGTSTLTLDQYSILKPLYDIIQQYDILTATTQIDDFAIQSSIQYVANLALASQIPFTIPNSKIIAPVPFGLSVEGIAARYLGDAQRWLEIVALNGLQEPYIDETGFTLPLLSNALGNQINVSDNTDLYVNQLIFLGSSTQVQTQRVITAITRLSSTNFLITLNGLANLGNYTLADGAYLQAYLPGTVNSQQTIYIPSDLVIDVQPSITPPASTTADPLVALSNVDLLLTSSGDLAINNYGDFRFSYGMTNLNQALAIKFGTVPGTVLLHPTFGLGVRPGTSNADLDLQNIYESINQMVVADPRFAQVSNLQIQLNGSSLNISCGILLANQTGIFPVNFTLT